MKMLIILISAMSLFGVPAYANIEQSISAFKKGNLHQAQQLLLQENDQNYEKHLYLARIALANDLLNDAKMYIENAISVNSEDAYSQFTYAEIMARFAEEASIFSVRGYIKKVKKGFEAAVTLAPANIQFRQALIRFHTNAPSILGGDIEKALQHGRELKAINALYGAGALIHVYGQMKDEVKFSQLLNTALKDFAIEPEIHYQVGLYYQNQEEYDKAISYFQAAANLNVTTEAQHQAKYQAVFQIGRTSILSDSKFDEGESALIKYMNEARISLSMPTRARVKFRLANIAEAKGEKEKARMLYLQVALEGSTQQLKNKANERIKALS